MIYLHTGQPGAGKTLLTLDMVRQRAQAENRPVFYHGIEILKPELFPGWELLDDPKKWMDCPDGSIVVHDECQTLYRPRGSGSAVPDYVARFETHRHNGWDIYLITQHPMLVDSNIRRLTGEHVHFVSAFGAGMATLHKWAQVKDQCDKARSDSLSETRAYPKALFGAYKSATFHTHKRRIPRRLYFLLLLPVLLGLIAWWVWDWYQSRSESVAEVSIPSVLGTVSRPGVIPTRAVEGIRSLESWVDEQKPRIAGLPHTAPIYDKVTQPDGAPYPAACVASATRCVCYTDQATRIDTPEALCRAIVKSGYYMAWGNAGRASKQQASVVRGDAVLLAASQPKAMDRAE